MATVPAVQQFPANAGAHVPSGVIVFKWTPIANGDDGAPVPCAHYPGKTVQAYGTPGAGGNLRWEGSLEIENPTNWFTLADPQGTALDFTAAKGEEVLENAYWIRPRATAGDGTTAWTALLALVTQARR